MRSITPSKILWKLVEFDTFSDVVFSNHGKSQIQCFMSLLRAQSMIYIIFYVRKYFYVSKCFIFGETGLLAQANGILMERSYLG